MTLTPAQIQALYKMPPGEASAYVAGRATMQVTYDWAQMRAAEHANAFTVSRLARADLLDALHRGIQKSVDGDMNRRDWVRDAKTLLKKEGWWGEITVPVGAQGDTVVTKFDSARLGLIFDTNTTTASNAGRWARFEKTKASHPYLRYMTRADGRVREQHAQWHNLTLPVDHSFWNTHAPQNGWRCRCVLIAERAKNVEGNPDLITSAPPIEYVAWNNKFTGQTEQIPKGIDPGWAYNVGNAGVRAAALKAQEQSKLAALQPAVAEQVKQSRLAPMGLRSNVEQLPPVPVVQVSTNAFGVGFSKPQLVKAASEHLRGYQNNGLLLNEDTGWELSINKKAREKIGKNKAQSTQELLAVSEIDALSRYAVRAETHPDLTHDNPDVQAVHRLYVPMQLDGKIYRVKLTVKEYSAIEQSSDTALHALEAVEIEEWSAPPGNISTYSNPVEGLQSSQPTTARAMSVLQLLATAKLQNGQPMIAIP